MVTGRRRRAGSLVLVLVVALVAGGVVGSGTRLLPGTGPPVPAERSGADLQRQRPPARLADPRTRAVEALLARRAAAVLHHDRTAFLATVDGRQRAFRSAQARLFGALAAVPLASWSYRVDTAAPARAVPAAGRYGASAVYAPAVVLLRYRLAGYDDAPVAAPQYLTFVRRGGTWSIGSDSDFDGSAAARTTREVWDYGDVVAVRSRRVLVLGHPADRALLQLLDAEAERDVPRVTAVWGTGWAQRIVVVVPHDVDELAHLVDRSPAALRQIAAVATAELPAGSGSAVGNRVLVNRANLADLSAVGRRVVITHEITHVATRAVTTPAAPSWLVEGFADYVAYLDTGVPVATAAHELADEVRGGQVPAALPRDADFAGADPRLPQVYEEAWLACRLIAARVGQPTLLRFYRAAADAPAGDGTGRMATAFQNVLHTSQPTFTRAWQTYLRTELA